MSDDFIIKQSRAGYATRSCVPRKDFAFIPTEGKTQWFRTAEEAVSALEEATQAVVKTISPAAAAGVAYVPNQSGKPEPSPVR